MEIGQPALLAKLPRAGLTGEGQTKFCQVYGIRSGQRKKRQEICAAVDGNSLNVIEVINGRNLASWPIPPDAAFVCEPLSERTSVTDGTILRRSWCAVQRKTQLSIQVYEQLRKGSHSTISSKSHALENQSRVLKIEGNGIGGDAIAIQEDGTLTILSCGDKIASRQLLLRDAGSTVKVLALHCLPLREAKLSILKSRQDVVSGYADESVVLAAVYEKPQRQNPAYGTWLVPTTPSTGFSESVEPLITHTLQLPGSSPKKTTFKFSPSCKQLRITSTNLSLAFDLTTIVPQKVDGFKHTITDNRSSLALSADIDLVMTDSELRVSNNKYNALLASASFTNSGLKRKRDADNTTSPSLIAYFSQLRRVLARSGNQLLSIDLRLSDQDRTNFRQSSLLIGNILRGTGQQADGPSTPEYVCSIGKAEQEKSVRDWPILSKDLDNLAEQKDAAGFTQRFTEAFGLTKAKDLKSSKIGESKLDYLLSKIFSFSARNEDHTREGLSINFLPVELLKWCISCGLLDSYRIAKALHVSGNAISPLAVAQALLDTDSLDLDLLHSFVQHSPYLEPDVLTFVISYLVRRIRIDNETDIRQRISNGGTDEAIASHQLTLTAQSRGDIRNNSNTVPLISALERLGHSGSSVVSKQVRQPYLEQSDIITLIQFLRQQLFLGGYYRLGGAAHYPSPPASNDGEEVVETSVPVLTLEVIVTLLDGCIDAIGPVGILGAADEDFLRQMISELQGEVSSASDAVLDSANLQGLVRETLRYAESVERQPFEVRNQVEKPARSAAQAKGQIVTLYTEATAQEVGVPGSALPLSLKAEESIDPFKVRRRGQAQRRSTREIGMLRDRLKAPYSFERLIL